MFSARADSFGTEAIATDNSCIVPRNATTREYSCQCEYSDFPDDPLTLLAGIDTLNYPYGQLGGSARNLKLIEKFRRVSAEILDYQFTVEDATTFIRPWTVSMPMRPANALFEYACHEKNYGMMNILRGARAADAETARGAR